MRLGGDERKDLSSATVHGAHPLTLVLGAGTKIAQGGEKPLWPARMLTEPSRHGAGMTEPPSRAS